MNAEPEIDSQISTRIVHLQRDAAAHWSLVGCVRPEEDAAQKEFGILRCRIPEGAPTHLDIEVQLLGARDAENYKFLSPSRKFNAEDISIPANCPDYIALQFRCYSHMPEPVEISIEMHPSDASNVAVIVANDLGVDPGEMESVFAQESQRQLRELEDRVKAEQLRLEDVAETLAAYSLEMGVDQAAKLLLLDPSPAGLNTAAGMMAAVSCMVANRNAILERMLELTAGKSAADLEKFKADNADALKAQVILRDGVIQTEARPVV